MKSCSINNCLNKKKSKDFCEKHWRRWKNTGDPEKTLYQYKREKRSKICVINNCDNKVLYLGFCTGHYKRYATHGNPEYSPLRTVEYGKKTCSIDGCTKKHNAKGLCNMHYIRVKKYGDPNAKKTKDKNLIGGYVYVGGRAEHRIVMEQVIGRALLPHENVHHKNGDKADNRPENLELWSISQPSGQRIEDKVKYAIEILSLYAPNLLEEKNDRRSVI